jgi:Fic family protein
MEYTDRCYSNVSEETREELDRRRYLEPINHRAAFLFMLDYIAEDNMLDWPFIINLHTKLMKGITQKNFGMPRRNNAYLRKPNGERLDISLARPGEIYLLITKLVEWIKSQEKEVGRYDISTIAAAHAEFIRIHPFEDGNGRVGRLLLNAMLLKSRYAPAIVSLGSNYYPVMQAALRDENILPLEKYITERSIKGFEYLQDLLAKP